MSKADEMRKKTACFTGHRQIQEPIAEVERRVTETVEALIQKGYLYFMAGGARGFDALASEVILKLKTTYPQIHLILVLPFDEQYSHEKNWTQAEVGQYHRLKEQASKVIVLAAGYSSGVYYRRNRHEDLHLPVADGRRGLIHNDDLRVHGNGLDDLNKPAPATVRPRRVSLREYIIPILLF